MKKVLMVARAFPPFLPVGHSIRVIKFIKYLPAMGWLPVVLTIDDQEEYETTYKVGSETLLAEIQSDVKIYRTTAGETSLKYLEKEKEFGQRNRLAALIVKVLTKVRHWCLWNLFLPDSYITWIPFAVKQGRKVVKDEGIDVIFATCPPYSATLIGAFLKILTGRALILDFRDDWIGTPWYLAKPTIARTISRMMESFVVNKADVVVLATEWSRKAFLNRYPAQPKDKFIFIPNGCDLEEFSRLNSMTPKTHNSKFTIMHAGSLNESKEWGRSAVGLFKAIQQIQKKQPGLIEDLSLVFIGDLPEGHLRLAEKMGLSNLIRGNGHLPHDEVLLLLRSADLLLAINYEGWSNIIPGKIYEYWAVGGPPILLLSCKGAAADFVEQHNLGITVEPSDISGIEQAVLKIYRRSKAATPMRVSTAGVEAFDRQALTRKLAQILTNAI